MPGLIAAAVTERILLFAFPCSRRCWVVTADPLLLKEFYFLFPHQCHLQYEVLRGDEGSQRMCNRDR
jgi:hypothetical protein